MRIRQNLSKFLYPLLMIIGKLGLNGKQKKRVENKSPAHSFYDLSVALNNGQVIKMEMFRGKKVMLVNTASACGYTPQYEQLQALYEKFNSKLEIIGFPANDFKEQEKGDDDSIAQFCRVNYGISFFLAKKSSVLKGKNQNAVYAWLTNAQQNGWNDTEPSWNFCKFLVDEEGQLRHFFEAGVAPTSTAVIQAIE